MIMNLSYWAKNPGLIVARIRYWRWERRNSTAPWLCPETVEFLEQRLNKAMVGLEFGSGRSTLWLAQRLSSVASVEHNYNWYRRTADEAEKENLNAEMHYVQLDHPESEPEREEYAVTPAYVAVLNQFPDASLDLIVVDGHYRTTIVKACPRKLRPGGLLLVDDLNLWPDGPPTPQAWQLVHRASNGLKATGVWQAP
jgi:predicted O-methyltransferase YrrM